MLHTGMDLLQSFQEFPGHTTDNLYTWDFLRIKDWVLSFKCQLKSDKYYRVLQTASQGHKKYSSWVYTIKILNYDNAVVLLHV